MNKIFKNIYFVLNLLGFNPLKFKIFFKGIFVYIKDYYCIKNQMKINRDFQISKLYPILDDKFNFSGIMNGHYFHQDLLIAQRIYANNPRKHIDIGSRIDGFVAHLAVFREIEVFDIRPQQSSVKNINFKQADLMQIQNELKDYCDSISSLHAIEHFGLGRYGDPIDINGHLKAITNIHAILKMGGKFYFSVPIGKQRIEFNAHRIFNIKYLLNIFNQKFVLDKFSYVNDKGDLFENVELTKESIDLNFNCNYGCGIFELIKI